MRRGRPGGHVRGEEGEAARAGRAAGVEIEF